MHKDGWRKLVGIVAVVVCGSLLQGASCLNLGPTTDSISLAFNNAMAELATHSDRWQATLQTLQATLVQQGQSTLANEVQGVLNRGLATTNTQFLCDSKFLAGELSEALQNIQAVFNHQPVTPPSPRVCTVDPDSIDLRLTPDRRPATLNLYGFNFDGNNIGVAVVDQSGSRTTPAPGIFTVPTEFKATFNIVNYPFGPTASYVAFTLPNREERRVTITQRPTCGGLDQACCTAGAPCDSNAGCLKGICVTCPPPFVPNKQEVDKRSNELVGNNCFGQDVYKTYGRACDTGYHRDQCQLLVVGTCGPGCSATQSWATNLTSDCTCIVHFQTPNDCTKWISVNVDVWEIQNPIERPAGCP